VNVVKDTVELAAAPMLHHSQLWIRTQKPAQPGGRKSRMETACADAAAEIGCVDWYHYPQPTVPVRPQRCG
jgi:hypothetical protein